jgi:hypothetical protein
MAKTADKTNKPGNKSGSKQIINVLPIPSDGSPAEKVSAVLRMVEEKLTAEEVKVTIGDYIRLLQLLKEYEGDTNVEIIVKWQGSQNGGKSNEQ